MSSMDKTLIKLREDRIAREKARIEKLRELNLKKYNKPEQKAAHQGSSSAVFVSRPSSIPKAVKNNFHVNSERPITAPVRNTTKTLPNKESKINLVPRTAANNAKSDTKIANNAGIDKLGTVTKKLECKNKSNEVKIIANNDKAQKNDKTHSVKIFKATDKNIPKASDNKMALDKKNVVNMSNNAQEKETKKDLKEFRKSFVPKLKPVIKPLTSDNNKKALDKKNVVNMSNNAQEKEAKKDLKEFRKSFVPNLMPVIKPLTTTRTSTQPSASKLNPKRQSVFERLYQPKSVTKKITDHIQGTKTEPLNLKKVGYNPKSFVNKRHSVFEPKKNIARPVRRSISAVHFKRVSNAEKNNCVHKWSSIGDKLNKAHLNEINEDDSVQGDKVVSAIKSERKSVQFQTSTNFNTPKSEELQARLQNWLKKRGKSLDSYHHLQCFGIHVAQKEIKPLNLISPLKNGEINSVNDQFDEENKENLPLDSDSDDDSYTENMNDRKNDFPAEVEKGKWRRASCMNDDSTDLSESQNTTLTTQLDLMTPLNKVHHVDELLIGALGDLTELLREGFDWEQSSRWLRALRERFPLAVDKACYWECRAVLEERRGDLNASVECWKEAIAKGTECAVVEANLDQLLDKFMQLKISPNSGKRNPMHSKLVDVKNIFKSTLIHFAVQQAKLRQSNQSDTPKFTMTPVRRSGRLSTHWSELKLKDKRTPLRVCTSVRQASLLGHPVEFVPNKQLDGTP